MTARGFGPQFNMVTLNGRQMPTADAFADGTVDRRWRRRQLALVQFREPRCRINQRGRGLQDRPADIATGGIGASINVRTARPLDNDGLVLNLGVKALNDTTNRVGDDFTPELSGIFSFANDDKTLRCRPGASYSKRDSGNRRTRP